MSLLSWWREIAIALLALALMGVGAAWKAEVKAHAEFRGGVEALGVAAKEKADATKLADEKRKEVADAENKRTLDSLRADNQRLRKSRAGGGFVPPAASGAIRPGLACFDRPELELAIRGLDIGLQELIDEGDAATVNLNTARSWAHSIPIAE